MLFWPSCRCPWQKACVASCSSDWSTKRFSTARISVEEKCLFPNASKAMQNLKLLKLTDVTALTAQHLDALGLKPWPWREQKQKKKALLKSCPTTWSWAHQLQWLCYPAAIWDPARDETSAAWAISPWREQITSHCQEHPRALSSRVLLDYITWFSLIQFDSSWFALILSDLSASWLFMTRHLMNDRARLRQGTASTLETGLGVGFEARLWPWTSSTSLGLYLWDVIWRPPIAFSKATWCKLGLHKARLQAVLEPFFNHAFSEIYSEICGAHVPTQTEAASTWQIYA